MTHRGISHFVFAVLGAALLWLTAMLTATEAQAQEYRIRAGDTLRIEVIEDSSLNRNVLVSPDGRISVPLAGTLQASGRTVEEVQIILADQLASNFASAPNVFVAVERVAEVAPAAPRVAGPPAPPPTNAIYLLGEVANPGKIEVEPGTTILQLFAQMGGFTRFAATQRIQLRRTDALGVETIYTLNYDAMLTGQSPNATALVTEGDVIVVPERGLFE